MRRFSWLILNIVSIAAIENYVDGTKAQPFPFPVTESEFKKIHQKRRSQKLYKIAGYPKANLQLISNYIDKYHKEDVSVLPDVGEETCRSIESGKICNNKQDAESSVFCKHHRAVSELDKKLLITTKML